MGGDLFYCVIIAFRIKHKQMMKDTGVSLKGFQWPGLEEC